MRNARVVSEQRAPYGRRGVRTAREGVPLLVDGAKLDADEFLRRYLTTDEDFRAELIDGVVHVIPSFVRIQFHGEPDSLIQTWAGTYAIGTRGVKSATNSTAKLSTKDVPQPDALLRILPEFGGKARVASDGYLEGAPELVVEIGASSALSDAREKRESYLKAGVPEYILWQTERAELDWWKLENGEYVPLQPSADGVLRSRVFPGLWLDKNALLSADGARVLEVLQMGLKSAEHRAFCRK
ncbi:MAG TPA: Uma2 family endonuclease [Planctomycetota bacterium]|nr:Uma2 family endonuclease [Planctomycetota bacterium]